MLQIRGLDLRLFSAVEQARHAHHSGIELLAACKAASVLAGLDAREVIERVTAAENACRWARAQIAPESAARSPFARPKIRA